MEPAVHGHPAHHHPAADHVHLLQPADRGGYDRRRGEGLNLPLGSASAAGVPETALAALTRSRAAGGDILPDRPDVPAPDAVWMYPIGEFEMAVLGRVVAEGFAASRHVHYSDNYGRPTGRARFRRRAIAGDVLRLRATGTVSATLDASPVEVVDVGAGVHRVGPSSSGVLEVTIECLADDAAALAVDSASAAATWERWDGTRDSWWPVVLRPGTTTPPHLVPEPTVAVSLRRVAGRLWRASAPLLGRPVVESVASPRFVPGETAEEALADGAMLESQAASIEAGTGRWTTEQRHAISFLALDVDVSHVEVAASVRPAPRRGAFVCDDPVLERIWATSAYTLRLCMQSLVVDGIKRDRMPWIGDQALGLAANAYSFADADIARDGLVALGRVRHGYVNGISDYSLWWLIAQGTHLDYFGDVDHVEREAAVIARFVADLATSAGVDGVFRPRPAENGFVDAGPGSVFLDWGVETEPDRDSVALQMLWYRSLRSAHTVLAAVGHVDAARWGELADILRDTLVMRGWHGPARVWRAYLDGAEPGDAYPNLLAVLAGIEPPGTTDAVLSAIEHGVTRTPFMRAFAAQAASRLGGGVAAVDRIRRDWGAMLDAGAATFWEDFPDDAESSTAMYGRPFGRSLCHAWAAGPAALLPELVLGVRPVAPGWAEFTLEPELGPLRWAAAVIPVPTGEIFARATVLEGAGVRVEVDIPEGCTLVRSGRRIPGPGSISWTQ